MDLVFHHNVAICFDARGLLETVMTLCCDPKIPFVVLINPFLFEPFPGIGIVRRDEMKSLTGPLTAEPLLC